MKILKSLLILTLFLAPASQAANASASATDSDNFRFSAALNFSAECDPPPNQDLTSENCGIVAYLVLAINVLSAVAGIAIVASIMIAGFQYMTARDNAGQVEAARKRIVWALLALLIFIFTYAFLNFVVPGGVL